MVVCGGGIGGIAAALAAARSGVSVCLLEKEYALGGLATLGLVVIYLPLCDGEGVKMSSGISEELLKLSLKYGPGEIPKAWSEESSSIEDRKKNRYRVTYNAASLMIAAEELLISHGVKLFYDGRVTGVLREKDNIEAVNLMTKSGNMTVYGKAFVDATGDGDLLWLAKEEVVDDDTNRRTGWYFSYNGKDLKLRGLSDPLYGDIPVTSRLYSGTNPYDITAQAIDGRKMILEDIKRLKGEDGDIYPLMIPLVPGFRMTRRLAGVFEFSADLHGDV